MFLLIDKPTGMTSHDVVDRVRRLTGERRVGHAGTLDPLATGLLIVGVGRESTKKLGTLSKETTKTYEAEIILGEERETDDAEGALISKAQGVLPPNRHEVELVLDGFVGETEQVPPKFSAVKVRGRKSYELARAGKNVVLKPRKVRMYRITLLLYSYPKIEFETRVSAGTYIRALARDVGRKLGMGAYLSALRRTRIGRYSLENARPLETITAENWNRRDNTLIHI